MRSSRVWSLSLLPGGLALGHLLGYAAAQAQGETPSLAGGHGYVHGLLVLAVPLSLAALARVGLSGARGERLPLGFSSLAAQQIVAYVALEVLEHATAGIDPLTSLREPTMLWGIVGQLLVAAGVALVARGVAAATGLVRPRRCPVTGRPTSWRVPVWAAVATVVPVSSLSRRGPPLAYC